MYRLPDSGLLVVDYQTEMEASHIKLFADWQIGPFLLQLEKRTMLDMDRMELVSLLCPHYHFTCSQAAQFIQKFGIGDTKVSACVLFMSRAIDLEENKWILLNALDKRDAIQLNLELAQYRTFSPLNPTG